jgi:hypothetical protein
MSFYYIIGFCASGYAYSEEIKNFAVLSFEKIAKPIIRHELQQKSLISTGSKNLNAVTIKNVLYNKKIVVRTSELICDVLKIPETIKLAQEQAIKAINIPNLKIKLIEKLDQENYTKDENSHNKPGN